MAKCSAVAAVALALLAAAILTAEPGSCAVDCNKARTQLAPCTAYLTGGSASPSTSCCSGVRYIKDNTVTQADRRSTCQCLKDTASKMSKLKDSAAQQLANKCKVQITVPISRTVNCNNL